MKNSYTTFVFIIGTILSIKVSASDSLSITKPIVAQVVGEVPSRYIFQNERKSLTDSSETSPFNGHKRPNYRQKRYESSNIVEEQPNPLLDFIQSYDVNANRVYPRPIREVFFDEELEYLKMSPIYMPLVFNSIKREFKIKIHEDKVVPRCFNSSVLDSLNAKYHTDNYVGKLTDTILTKAEVQHIELVKFDKKNLPRPDNLIYYLNSSRSVSLIKPSISILNNTGISKNLPKAGFDPWTKNVYVKLQFSQTYNSPNWSRGGESNMAGLTTIFLQANYSNLKNVQFDNNIEAKVGLNTVSSDSLRNLNVSTDQLRAVTKLGIRMHNDFYYSLSGEFTTQFLNNYKANTMTLKSAFMSPAKLFVGLGIDYKKSNQKKGYNLSVLMTPLTSKMSYLYDNKNMKPKSFGIKDGEHFVKELGSKISATLNWKISEVLQWNSKFYYYTDFTYVDTDWENTFDLNLNTLFTTSFYVHLKLDDRIKPEPGQSLVQMQELFSFGMIYRW